MGAAWMRAGAAGLVLAGAAAAPAGDGGAAPRDAARMDPDPACLKPGESRSFTIAYGAVVKDVPLEAKRLRVWVPVPQDTPVQAIRGLEFRGPVAPRVTVEKRFGNRLAYYEVGNPGATMRAAPGAKTLEWATSYSFTCTRREQVTDLEKVKEDGAEWDARAAEFLGDDRLTIVDDRIRKMAAAITAGKRTTLEKARAIYDAVLDRMTYDKSGTGWGRGDTNFACDVGKGNCTDFHALFMSLCRAERIPAGFEIGLYAPYKRKSDEMLGGYHCWAFFRVPGRTWVPVDASEADRDPARREYFFGSHTNNRVTLSVGRDLVLEPRQDGEPLNYLLNPYAEADGKPLPTSKDWTFRDLD